MPLRSTRALPLAVSALVGATVCASAVSATRQTKPLPKAMQKAATIGIRIHSSYCIILKRYRFSEKITLKVSIGGTRESIDAHPTVRHQPLLRQKAAFVIHLA